MGRRRKTDKHLPAKVYLEHGSYYFRSPGQPRKNLGRDFSAALILYASLVSDSWSGRTLADVIDRYRGEVLPLKRSDQTKADQARQLERLRSAFGHLLPDSVTAQHCYKYADARRSKDGKPVPVAARHEITLLAHVFKYAIRWGKATANPASGLDVSERAGKRRQVMMDEVLALHALATERMQLAIELAINIGQRQGDLLKLKRSDIQGERLLHIEQGKTSAKIDMPISPVLADIIARLKALKPQLGKGAEYLLRSRNGDRYTSRGFKANWQRLMAKYLKANPDAKRFTFHDLRSVSANGAATPEEARARLGHANVATTKQFYWHGAEQATPRE